MSTRTSNTFARKLSAAMAGCTAEVSAYGMCAANALPDIPHKHCEHEFMRLKDCFHSSVSTIRTIYSKKKISKISITITHS